MRAVDARLSRGDDVLRLHMSLDAFDIGLIPHCRANATHRLAGDVLRVPVHAVGLNLPEWTVSTGSRWLCCFTYASLLRAYVCI